jgi:hypothetical protein
LITNPSDFKILYIKAKSLINSRKKDDAIIIIKKALSLKPSKTLLAYLNKYENLCSTIDEKVCSENYSIKIENNIDTLVKDESNNQEKIINPSQSLEKCLSEVKSLSSFSKYTIIKILKLICYSCNNFVRKNKFFVLCLSLLIVYYFKKGIQQMVSKSLSL